MSMVLGPHFNNFGSLADEDFPVRGRHTDDFDLLDDNYPARGRHTDDFDLLDDNYPARGWHTAGSWYYHYTSPPSLEAINRCGFIKQSLDDIFDAVAGKGVYLTKIPPYGMPKEQISMQIYTPYYAEQKIREGKLDRCIGLWLNDSDVKYVHADGRDIFVYPEDLYLLKFNFYEFCL